MLRDGNTPKAPGAIEAHGVEFSGSGGEYFRVWLVNVLLTALTLGFYTPFARKRRAQYFYSHTLVAGSPLEFTAQQRRMVFGFLVVVGLYLAFKLAAETGQDMVVSLFTLAGAALAPYFWASAMRFRLGSTRWRGVRPAFTASWAEIYKASWPVFVLAAVIATIAAVGGMLHSPKAWLLLALPGLIASFLCVVRLEFNYRALLVRRAAMGTQAGRWKPVYRDFVRIWLVTAGVLLLSALVVAAVLMVLVFVFGGMASVLGRARGTGIAAILFFIFVALAAFFVLLLASVPARAYREAALFRLTWSNVGLSQIARFKCRLSVRGYVWLRVRNAGLTLVTLGFYRPFALVAEYRMKADSVTLHVKGGLDQMVGRLAQQQGGVGDAVADAVGLDLIS